MVSQVRQLMKSNRHVRGALNRDGNAGKSKVPLDEFVALLYENGGSAYKVAKLLDMSHTMVAHRRSWIEEQLGIVLPRARPEVWKQHSIQQNEKIYIDCGTVIVGSDLHAWPELYGTAMAGFVDLTRRLKPDFVIMNGDGLDGAGIGRHPRIGWEGQPTTKEELDALKDYLDEVHKASPNSKKRRTKGNHDARFDSLFSAQTPEAEGIRGTALADHLPGWDEVMSIDINDICTIKHRHRSGIHVAWTNVRDYGCHIITGHTHRQNCRPWTNKLGTWYGVDAGMLAPTHGPQFGYTESSPGDWRSGFVVLTFRDGKLMPPDLATVTDEDKGELYFRGQTYKYEL